MGRGGEMGQGMNGVRELCSGSWFVVNGFRTWWVDCGVLGRLSTAGWGSA